MSSAQPQSGGLVSSAQPQGGGLVSGAQPQSGGLVSSAQTQGDGLVSSAQPQGGGLVSSAQAQGGGLVTQSHRWCWLSVQFFRCNKTLRSKCYWPVHVKDPSDNILMKIHQCLRLASWGKLSFKGETTLISHRKTPTLEKKVCITINQKRNCSLTVPQTYHTHFLFLIQPY